MSNIRKSQYVAMNGSRAVSKQLLGGFASVSNLPCEVVYNNAKFDRNMYNDMEMYKEEKTRRHTPSSADIRDELFLFASANETCFLLPDHESVPVNILQQHTTPVRSMLHISLFSPVSAHISVCFFS
jgi:hypothetical protein